MPFENFEISIADEITPFVQRAIAHNKAYERHVLKALGYEVQKRTKKEISTGNPFGLGEYQERLPQDVRDKLAKTGSAAKRWYGKMKNAIGYAYKDGRVDVGWTSSTAAQYGRMQEYGYKIETNEHIRAYWHKHGVPLSAKKKYLIIPKRPVFDPAFDALSPQFGEFVEKRVRDYLDENIQLAKKSRRVYKVYR